MAVNVEIKLKGAQKTAQGIGNVAGAMSNFAATAAGVVAGAALVGIARGLSMIGRDGLQAVASTEMLKLSLQSLVARELLNAGAADTMGKAMQQASERAAELFDWTVALAKKSPFDQAGIATAFRTALAYGFTTEQSQRLTMAMVDFTAATGAGKDAMQSIALALGQMQAKGKVAGQELLQLVNAGVPALQIMAKHFGKTTAEMQQMLDRGLVPVEEAIDAIVTSMEDDFGGAAERSSEKWAGLINTLGDLKELGLVAMLNGVGDALSPVVANFADWMEDEGIAKLSEFGENLGNIVGTLVDIKNHLEFVAQGGDPLMFIFKTLPEDVQKLVAPLAITVAIFRDWFTILKEKGLSQLLQDLGILPANFGLVSASVANLAEVFKNELLPVIVEEGGKVWDNLAQAWEETSPQIADSMSGALDVIAQMWSDWGPSVIAVVGQVFSTILATVVGVLGFLAGFIEGALILIQGIISAVLSAINGDWAGAWASLSGAAEGAWEAIKAGVASFIGAVAGSMGGTMEEIGANWSSSWNNLKAIVNVLAGKIKAALGGWVGDWKTAGVNAMQGLIDGIASLAGAFISKLIGIAVAAIEGVKAVFGDASPAKAFIAIGENVMKGLEVGVVGMAPGPIGALETVATRMVDQPFGAGSTGGSSSGGSSGTLVIEGGVNFYGVIDDTTADEVLQGIEDAAAARGWQLAGAS